VIMVECVRGWSESLLPHLVGVLVGQVEQARSGLLIWARVKAEDRTCPACGERSRRVHSRYDRRLANASTAAASAALSPHYRRTLVDSYRDHLRRRLTEQPGIPIAHLLAEIREPGYPGSADLLVRYLEQGRADPERLLPTPRRLDAWIMTVRADNLPALRRFTDGLTKDYDAVVAGLALSYSNGPHRRRRHQKSSCSSVRPTARPDSPYYANESYFANRRGNARPQTRHNEPQARCWPWWPRAGQSRGRPGAAPPEMQAKLHRWSTVSALPWRGGKFPLWS
jgi:hypothetical protein